MENTRSARSARSRGPNLLHQLHADGRSRLRPSCNKSHKRFLLLWIDLFSRESLVACMGSWVQQRQVGCGASAWVVSELVELCVCFEGDRRVSSALQAIRSRVLRDLRDVDLSRRLNPERNVRRALCGELQRAVSAILDSRKRWKRKGRARQLGTSN
jgi:hypothetical protein